METKTYTQERECLLEECLGDDCPVMDIGGLGEHLDSLYSIHDNTSHEIFHYQGNTIVRMHRREKVEEVKEVPSPVEGKPPSRRRTFVCHWCVTQVKVCGNTAREVIEEIADSARATHRLTPEKAVELVKRRAKRDNQRSLEHVKKYPHVYRDPERKLLELETALIARLSEAENLRNLDPVYKIVSEKVE